MKFSVAVLAVFLGLTHAWEATLYDDIDHQGRKVELKGEGCVDVDSAFDNRASSVNTHGNCLRLYKDAGCLGDKVELFPLSAEHNNLERHKFNDVVSSVGPCPKKVK